MSLDLIDTPPPDDTGTDVFRRYRYQAHVAFPFCLNCATGGKVLSVMMEHFEDLVVEYQDQWHFVQIKTRDPDQGPWKLSHTLSASGGLRSLARTFLAVRGCGATFSLFLEGAIAAKDPLNHLVSPTNPSDGQLHRQVRNSLKLDEEDCKTFLQLTTVRPNQVHRDHISGYNVALFGRQAPHLSHIELTDKYERAINEILAAMAREPLRELLPVYVNDPDTVEDSVRSRVEAKRLNRDRLQAAIGQAVDTPYPLLQRLVEPQTAQPSDLEAKLLAGGAEERIVNDAKRLRANAASREAEIEAAELYNPLPRLEDVHERLIVLNNAIVQSHTQDDRPAIIGWKELLDALMHNADSIDPNQIYGRDPFLLLGATCDLADRCLTDWGVPIA